MGIFFPFTFAGDGAPNWDIDECHRRRDRTAVESIAMSELVLSKENSRRRDALLQKISAGRF
jgi:hypothetical protein